VVKELKEHLEKPRGKPDRQKALLGIATKKKKDKGGVNLEG